jgi:phage terminase large subunit-like protein
MPAAALREHPGLAAALAELSDDEALDLLHDWSFWARPEQLAPPPPWFVWLILAGRGWGKTRVGAEWLHARAMAHPGCRLALVGRTVSDVRDTMLRGESGLLTIAHPDERPEWVPSQRLVRWPNGATALTFSADEPDQLRGPQHHGAWADEPAAWRYPEAWAQLLLGLRLGRNPQVVATTTPRGTRFIRELVEDPDTIVVRGRTKDNAHHLAASFLRVLERKYGGTRLGRQELDAEILDDTPGALWKREPMLDAHRVRELPPLGLVKIIVAVDPATTATDESDETGIVVVGLDVQGHVYVLGDLSGRYSPEGWAAVVAEAFETHQADSVIAEANQGGDMVATILRTCGKASLPIGLVHASRGKRTRAEPVAALYEQGRVHHLGTFAELEDQLCTWVPGMSSPDRLDALVWGVTSLGVNDVPAISPDYDVGAFR